jgi:hypothetical protein
MVAAASEPAGGISPLDAVRAVRRRTRCRRAARRPVSPARFAVVVTHDQRVSPLFAIGSALMAIWFFLVAA